MQRSITASGLSLKEVLLIKSYLSLLPGKTREPWTFLEAGPADVEVVPTGQPATSARIRIEYGDGEAEHLCLRPPLRVANVIAVLDEASALLDVATPAVAPTAATAAPLQDERDTDHTTLAALLRDREPTAPVLLFSNGETWIEADFTQRRYRSSEPLTAAHASQSGWQRAASAPVSLATEGQLTYLLWMAGVAEARIAPGRYQLRRWPDFGRLPHRPSFVRLAAYFAKNGVSPSAAADAATVPFPEVKAFLGGCVLAGFATRVDDANERGPVAMPTASPGVRGFLLRVRQRLGL